MFFHFDCFLYFTNLNYNNQSFLACLNYSECLNVQPLNIDKVSFFFIAIFLVILCSPTVLDSSKLTCRLDYLPVD